jgi:hypothetical protein
MKKVHKSTSKELKKENKSLGEILISLNVLLVITVILGALVLLLTT